MVFHSTRMNRIHILLKFITFDTAKKGYITLKFEELNIKPELLRAIKYMGFEEATPIQAKAISAILEGKDIIGQAQTGTGKTAAFGIPAIEKIDTTKKAAQAIILCPTRELAVQVSEELHKLCKYMHNLKTVPIYGGQDIVRQIKALKSGAQIIVGTPGRTLDHIRRKTISFQDIKMVILDEADEMLQMGFREDIETVLSAVPDERQTILFSATMPKPIMEIAKNYQHNSEVIKVIKKELTVANIDQYYYEVRPQNKLEVLSRLIDINNPNLSVVFCNTKHQVDELVNDLQGRGYFAEGLHGDMKQQSRDRVMRNCRKGKTDILVATDVAARGIDLENVDIVFNYDLPQDEEYYVHRIGRTGRAGRTGQSLSFVVGREIYKLKEIERYCKTKILARPIPTLSDVATCKIDSVLHEIQEIIEQQNMTELRNNVEEMTNSSDLTAMDIAAALLYKTTIANNEEVEIPIPYSARNKEEKRKHKKDGKKKFKQQKGMVRLFLNVGKKDKLRAGDILGAIAGESKVSGSLIGSIDMYDNYTFVDVPEEISNKVMKAMKKATIKGRKVSLEPANVKKKNRK